MDTLKKTCLQAALIFCCFIFQINAINAQLYINELMASNSSTIADESGDFDDWVEIYNAGASDVNLAGYYMSDDPAAPTLWQIPATNATLTTVSAGGFLILWADKDIADGANHLNFKLSGGGESVSLLLPDGSTQVDAVTFGAQNTDVSYGRTEDGMSSFQTFPQATPGTSNTSSGPATYPATFSYPVTSNSDDAEQFPNGTMKLISSDLEMTEDGPNQQTVGIRFTDIDIPQGTTITNAYIQFTSFQESIGTCNLTFAGDNNVNPATFSETAFDLSNRSLTSATINWAPTMWPTANLSDSEQKSPDISNIIQELIDNPSWNAGNAMALLITGTGTRTAYSHDVNPIQAAKLILEVALPAPTEPVVDLFINEVAARGTDYTDEADDHEDWVELYNGSTEAVAIGGLYLTDDASNLTKWQVATSAIISPDDHLIIWTDNDPEEGVFHTNFKLSGSGGTLALVQVLNNAATIIDSVQFGDIPFKATYGRLTDGNNNWVTFGEITPDAANDGSGLWLAPPSFSLANGAYTGSQSLILSHPSSGVEIRYTSDGSDPTAFSPAYNSTISINSNQAVKAIAIKSGYANSLPGLRSYLIDTPLNLPTLFLTSDPDNFFSDESGIYVVGTNGVTGFCSNSPRNWAHSDWERPGNLTLFETDGSEAFNVNIGVQIGGACSRNFALKGLNIYLREKKYGDANLNYQLYKGRDHNNYYRFKLRNSGQDFVRMGFRDGLVQTLLWDAVDLDLQGFLPTVMYLNGDYWGIHNIRENYNDEYFETNYGIKSDELDLIKSPGLSWQEVKKGDDLNYMELFNFIENNDLSVQANYDHVESRIDMNEFTNYWITMGYTANYDWPANNVIVWRKRKNTAKWRWAVLDTDGSTGNGLSNQADFDFNTLEQITDPNSTSWPNHQNSTLFLRGLLENTQFRDEYIQRNCSYMELVFNPDRVNMMTDSIENLFIPEIDAHIAKWGFDNAMGGDYWSWNTWVNQFREFFEERPTFFRGFIDDYFNLNGTYELSVIYDANTGGDVFVNTNSMAIPYNYIGTYFKDIPLRVSAVAKAGYVFSHWLETGETNPVIDFVSSSNTTLTPIFTQGGLNLNLGSDLAICEGETLTLNASVAGCTDCTYLWDDNWTNPIRIINPIMTDTYSVTVTNSAAETADDIITITVNALPNTSISSSNVSCEGAADGSVDLSVTGGTAPYDYVWNNQASTQDLTNLNPGNYSVTITDDSGCSSTEATSISEPIALLFNLLSESDISCFNANDGYIDIGVADGTPPYNFLWSNGATTEDIDNLSPGDYTITVTESNNCQTIQLYTIDEPAAIELNATSSNIVCYGETNGAINLSVNGGTGTYTFLWSNGAISESINNLPVGSYTITVTDDNFCESIETYQIDESTEQLLASSDATNLDCFNDNDAAILLTVNGGTTPYSFLWSNGATTQNISNLSGGTFAVTITDGNGCEFIESGITINIPTELLSNTTVTTINCFDEQDGGIITNPSGGTEPYTHLWSTGDVTPNLFNLSAGTYTLTLTDNQGCQTIETTTLTAPSEIVLNYTTSPISCNGYTDSYINLSVSGGAGVYTFIWNNGAISEDVYNLSAGYYEVTITDANSCQHVEAYTITEPDALDEQATVIAVSCDGVNNGAIQTNPIGGTAPYTYAWSTGSNLQNISNLTPGNYMLTLSDANNCQIVQSYNVDEVDGLFIDFVTSPISCSGANDGSLTANITGGTGVYTYLWDNGATTSTINNLGSGFYQLTVVDNGNCEAIQSFEIIEPTQLSATTITTAASCGNDNGSIVALPGGGTAPYTYLWNTGATTAIISDLIAGTYDLTLSDNNACLFTLSETIAATEAISVSSVLENVSCYGSLDGTIALLPVGGNGNYSYLWSNGDFSQNISGLDVGEYFLTITDNNDCELLDTFMISAPDSLLLDFAITSITCFAGTDGAIDLEVLTGGVAPFNYTWSNGETTEDIIGLGQGEYEVTITDANQCVTITTIEVISPDAIDSEATITEPGGGEDNGSISVIASGGTAPYTYQWSNGETTPTISNLAAGVYTLAIIDANGCQIVSSYSLQVSGFGDINNSFDFDIYPNPSDGKFLVTIINAAFVQGQVSVYNVLGQTFFNEAVSGSQLEVTVDLGGGVSGVYFVKLEMGEEVLVRKVVIGG